MTHTISGIDMALWDILGKVAGQPIWRLLGGRFRDHLKPYASMLIEEPEKMTEKLQAAQSRGFRAFTIAQYADDHSIMVVPHGWNTGVGLAADLHLTAAAGNAKWVEFLTPEPYMDEVFAEPISLNAKGLLPIPEGPGYGFQWNAEGIAKLSDGVLLTPSVL